MNNSDPLWYKDAIVYQLHVRAFFDADGDGIGDFTGLTEKLDYLHDLGVTAIWLLPFYPSPLKDDGYDIADYTSVNPSYGTMEDFKVLLREAHRRGLRVINELVLNHTSDRHEWFQRARRAPPGSPERDYYVWSDTPKKYEQARIIFQDFEPSNWSWDPVAQAYYWHRFYHHQPDLNFDNPRVHEELLRVGEHWMGAGVDGMRLDAVPYLYEREGTNCENLPLTHAFLKKFRAHLDSLYPGRMLLAEANQWPEDSAAYFGDGDECHTAFHFPVMPRLFMSVQMEDRFPIIDILDQTPAIPDTCQWFVFLRNHDELTLEMVTDEERDYMVRVYARDPRARVNLGIRRRLAPLLGNDRRKIELLNGLLMTLPGTPVIYYGDEIGMGDNIYLGDRDGVRTPMQWSSDRNAGFSRANPQQLFLPVIVGSGYHYEAINVEAQYNNPNSLWWWMKRLIALRKQFQAFGRGDLQLLDPENSKVLAFTRSYGRERLLIVANLSRFSQFVELDLSSYLGTIPVELFGRTEFPRIGELPYLLTLGPHAFYIFSLSDAEAVLPERVRVDTRTTPDAYQPPTIAVQGDWQEFVSGPTGAIWENHLPDILAGQRWFTHERKSIRSVEIADSLPLTGSEGEEFLLVLMNVDYLAEESETFLMALACHVGDRLPWSGTEGVPPTVAELQWESGQRGTVYDATAEPTLGRTLVESICAGESIGKRVGAIAGVTTEALNQVDWQATKEPRVHISLAEEERLLFNYDDRLSLKLGRRVEDNIDPDWEIGRRLTRHHFPHTPPVVGALEYRVGRQTPRTLATLRGAIRHETDAWHLTADFLGRYIERIMAEPTLAMPADPPRPFPSPWSGTYDDLPPTVLEFGGESIRYAELLGQRVGELHMALAAPTTDEAFAPEAFTQLSQRSLYQRMRTTALRLLRQLQRESGKLPDDVAEKAEAVIEQRDALMQRFDFLLTTRVAARRIRCHGDLHLGRLLFTGRDFAIADFDGDTERTIGERRIKRCALSDVADLIYSAHHATAVALAGEIDRGVLEQSQRPLIDPWTRWRRDWSVAVMLRAYLDVTRPAEIVPDGDEQARTLLVAMLLHKQMAEATRLVQRRPDWLGVPLAGILELLSDESGSV